MAAAVEVNLRWLARFPGTPDVHALAPLNEPVAFGKNAITHDSPMRENEAGLFLPILLGPAVNNSHQAQRLAARCGL
jgi:hypothetical protein